MRYDVVERQPAKLVVRAYFEAAEIEGLATDRAHDLLDGDFPCEQAQLKSNVALLSSLAQFESVMKLALQDAYYLLQPRIMEREQAVPVDAPHLQLIDGDFADSFEVMLSIPVAEGISQIVWRDLDVRYHPVTARGNEVAERIAEVCAQYEVESPEALIEKTRLYESVEQMNDALGESLSDFMEQVNRKAVRDGVCEALLRANRFDVSADLLEGYVDREIAQIVSQIGHEMYIDHLSQTGRDEAGFRAEVAEKVADIARLDIILDAIASGLGQEVDDAQRIAKIEEQRAQALDPRRAESAESVLGQIRANPRLLRSLDDSVRRDRAIDHVASLASFKELAPMGLDEYTRYQRASGYGF